MSELLSTIAGELGPGALTRLGSSVGATPEQTESASGRRAARWVGAERGGQGMLGNLLGALAAGPAPPGLPSALNGAGILGHVLGDQQGAVARKVAQVPGLSPEVVARLLPVLAPVA